MSYVMLFCRSCYGAYKLPHASCWDYVTHDKWVAGLAFATRVGYFIQDKEPCPRCAWKARSLPKKGET